MKMLNSLVVLLCASAWALPDNHIVAAENAAGQGEVKPTGLIGSLGKGIIGGIGNGIGQTVWDSINNQWKNAPPPMPGPQETPFAGFVPPVIPPNVQNPFVIPAPPQPQVFVNRWRSPVTGQFFELREINSYVFIHSLDPNKGPPLVGTGFRQGHVIHMQTFGAPQSPLAAGQLSIYHDRNGVVWINGLVLYRDAFGNWMPNGFTLSLYRVR